MKKILGIILAVCVLLTLPVAVSAEGGAASTKVVFPGSNFAAWNPAGVWLTGEATYAQAFNVDQPILGFVMTAWAAGGTSSLYYMVCEYHTDVETSVDKEDLVTEGFVPIEDDNPLDWEVLFDEEIPAGKYVLILRSEYGQFGLNLVNGKTEKTDFWCSEGTALVDIYGMPFDPTVGDPTVMAGGLIFSGEVDESAYLSMEADSVKPTKEPAAETEAPTEAPETEAPATEAPATEAPAEETKAPASDATKAPADDTAEAPEKSGCGSVIGGSAAVLAVLAAAVVGLKKKEV